MPQGFSDRQGVKEIYQPLYQKLVDDMNYGFIKGVTAPDGASQAAYISGVDTAIGEFTGKIIAVVHRYDDIAQN